MRNIYSLLSFAFIMCGLCINTHAYEKDSSTVSKNDKDTISGVTTIDTAGHVTITKIPEDTVSGVTTINTEHVTVNVIHKDTVSENPKNVLYRHKYSIGLNRNPQFPDSERKLKISRIGAVKEEEDKGIPILFGGYMSFPARYRNIKSKYWPVQHKSLQIPYNGAPLITLNMNMQISPGFNVIMIWGLGPGYGSPGSTNAFNGSTNPDSARTRSGTNGNFGAVVNYKTRYAMIKLGAGSIVTGMSNLLVNGAGNFGRTSPFYRLPWDATILQGGAFMNIDNNTFRYGAGNANTDPFFTNGGRTRGFVLQLSQMPLDLGLNVGYGVDNQTFGTGGVYNLNNTIYDLDPTKKTFGTRLYKKTGVNIFGANLILNNGHFETVSEKIKETQYMYTGDVFLRLFDYYTIQAEAGVSAFTNPYGKWDPDQAFAKFYGKKVIADPKLLNEYKSPVSFVGKLNIQVDQRKFGLPIQIGAYSLGPNYVNLNSNTFNTYTQNNSAMYISTGKGWDYGMRRGVIADVGTTANNRRAVELNTSIGKGKFRINIGSQVGQEILKEDSVKLNRVMFNHKLNVFSTSSFQPYVATGGPYGSLLSTYFQLQENVVITDAVINYKKTFNSAYYDARYKTNLFGKQLLFENYTTFQSASDHLSPLPFVTDKAFVRVLFSELMCWYRLRKNLTFVGLAAIQRAVGNNRTQLADPATGLITTDKTKGKPINQIGYGIGGGLDFDIDSSKGLYWRVMWNSHKDNHFTKDTYTLFETTLDFKVYF
jgi:hypothetical protein